jgi:hypothetical protein
MKQITKTYKVYSFSELSESAKQKALEQFYDINTSYEWHDDITDMAKEVGRLLGIEIENVWFSGFSSQGDGACFEGRYSYQKGGVQAVKEYREDKELHQIAERLQSVQKRHFYQLSANVEHRGHYYHEMCTDIDVYKDGNYMYSESEQEAEEEIKDILRDFMRWIYSRLEKEYDYRTSEEAIIESIEANNYQFLASGIQYY